MHNIVLHSYITLKTSNI